MAVALNTEVHLVLGSWLVGIHTDDAVVAQKYVYFVGVRVED
jgi:hypothetical protein